MKRARKTNHQFRRLRQSTRALETVTPSTQAENKRGPQATEDLCDLNLMPKSFVLAVTQPSDLEKYLTCVIVSLPRYLGLLLGSYNCELAFAYSDTLHISQYDSLLMAMSCLKQMLSPRSTRCCVPQRDLEFAGATGRSAKVGYLMKTRKNNTSGSSVWSACSRPLRLRTLLIIGITTICEQLPSTSFHLLVSRETFPTGLC